MSHVPYASMKLSSHRVILFLLLFVRFNSRMYSVSQREHILQTVRGNVHINVMKVVVAAAINASQFSAPGSTPSAGDASSPVSHLAWSGRLHQLLRLLTYVAACSGSSSPLSWNAFSDHAARHVASCSVKSRSHRANDSGHELPRMYSNETSFLILPFVNTLSWALYDAKLCARKLFLANLATLLLCCHQTKFSNVITF